MNTRIIAILFGVGFLLAQSASALITVTPLEIRQKTIEYKQGNTTLEGVLVYNAATKKDASAPGILVVHDWMGVGPFAIGRAHELVKMGYIAFVADIYGQGVRPANAAEAGKQASKYKNDRARLRGRVNAALAVLRSQPGCDSQNLAAIGYCFGGTTVLELARSGAAIKGVVSFHGGLDSPTPADANNIQCKVLALHGADDPHVPPAEVNAFQDEMRQANVDWQLISYGGAVHAFTNPQAGNDNSRGAAYNATADRRSWQAMTSFLAELFGGSTTGR